MSVFIGILWLTHTIWLTEGTIIYSAQCRSRCHSNYNTRTDQQKLTQCLSPCDEDYAKLGSCRDFCKPQGDDIAPCHFSCKNLKDLYRNSYGKISCSHKKPSGYEYCDKNIRCDQLKECCSTTNTCEDIVVHGEEVEVVAAHVSSSSLLATWPTSNITNAVYIIQLREVDSKTIHYTDDDWLPWRQIKQDVNVRGVRLSRLPSGVRLQLRVAIVNSTGLQSIGPPSRVIRTLFNATNPSGPEQIWVMKKAYYKNLVGITLVWTPPIVLDVPVHSYRIYWKQIPLSTADRVILTKKRTRVAGTQYNYTIENLKPDTTYNIEIEAICLSQKKKLKSPKVGLNVSTGHIKDDGKGMINVYFIRDKSKKNKENNHSTKYYDQSVKEIKVFIEKQNSTEATPSNDPNESAFNSARQTIPNLSTIMLMVLCLLAVTTN